MRRIVAACAACITGALPFASHAAGESLELAVKAQFLTRFPGFVEWPASAFAAPNSPVQLCVVGDDPFGDTLDKAAAGQQAAARPVVVRRVKSVRADGSCHVIYFPASEAPRQSAQIDAIKAAPVLTVTDARSGASAGIVHFVLSEQRVRFEIDEEAASQAGLSISSKLLGLALTVKPRKGGAR